MRNGILRSYFLGLLYSKYSLSICSEVLRGVFLASGLSFTSGYISTSQASPPIVSQASAGKTLDKTCKESKLLIITSEVQERKLRVMEDRTYEEKEL